VRASRSTKQEVECSLAMSQKRDSLLFLRDFVELLFCASDLVHLPGPRFFEFFSTSSIYGYVIG
jgi:hypothetical protein